MIVEQSFSAVINAVTKVNDCSPAVVLTADIDDLMKANIAAQRLPLRQIKTDNSLTMSKFSYTFSFGTSESKTLFLCCFLSCHII